MTSTRFQSRVQGQDGSPCLGIGVKTGKAILTLTAKASLFKLHLAMVGQLLATMLFLRVGNSAKLLKDVNFNIFISIFSIHFHIFYL